MSVSALLDQLRDRTGGAEQVAAWCMRVATESQANHPVFVEAPGEAVLRAARVLDGMSTARRAELPLFGVPVGIKDNVAVRGTSMRAGSEVVRRQSARDAYVVRRLRRAGALILGRTRMHELAFGPTGTNAHDGGVTHPFAADRVPGGSSSGSAVAVALGICAVAVGTDTGGSVRIPAALCGVVGYKPTLNLLPLAGVLPLAPTLDHIGILGFCVDDVRQVASAIAGLEIGPARQPRRLGVLRGTLAGMDSEVARAFTAAVTKMEKAGTAVTRVVGPDQEAVIRATTEIMSYEAYRTFGRLLRTTDGVIGADVRERLEYGSTITARAYDRALRARDRVRAKVERILLSVDGILGPTVPVVAPRVSQSFESSVRGQLVRHTRLFNLTGGPAVSIPLARRPLGIGMQLAMGLGADAELLAFAAWMSTAIEEEGTRSRGPGWHGPLANCLSTL